MPEPAVTIATCVICVVLFLTLVFLPDADEEDEKSDKDSKEGLATGSEGGHLTNSQERPTLKSLEYKFHEQSPLLSHPSQA